MGKGKAEVTKVNVRRVTGLALPPPPPKRVEVKCDCVRCHPSKHAWPNYYVGNVGHARERVKWLIKRLLKLWRKRQKLGRRKVTRARTDRAFLWIRLIVNEARWRESYECYWELEARPDAAERGPWKPPTEAQAIEEGLSVRQKGKHGYFAPLLLRGRCDKCGRLRPSVRRFCLNCETLLRRELAKAVPSWPPYLVEHYLAVPVMGVDQFAEGVPIEEKTMEAVVSEALTSEIAVQAN